MSRLVLAFRSFFAILFGGRLPEDIAAAFDFVRKEPPKPAPPPAPVVKTSDGALQFLGILQRDARLLDFLMEDISGYEDDQVGAAVRAMHGQSRKAITQYLTLVPVIDGVEGTATKLSGSLASDPTTVKLLGNVPATGKATTGILRHKGWKVEKVDLPALSPKQNVSILAPAEVEIE